MSFWLPGLFGSLAATPQQPGWSLSTIYYHTTVSAGADIARAREITIGRIPVNLSANLSANLDARADLAIVNPTDVFATPSLGGQAAVGLMGIYGRTSTSLAGTLSGALTTAFGAVPFLRSDSISDSVTGSATCTRSYGQENAELKGLFLNCVTSKRVPRFRDQ